MNSHFLSVEALPSSKFWKSENGPISWTVKNIVMKFCIHTDIDKMYPMRLSNDIWDWSRFCRGSNAEKSETGPLLNLLVYFDKILHTHYYWHDLDWGTVKSSPRDCKMTFNIGRGCAKLQFLEKWKWPNWVDYCDETAYTLILTRCSQRDCQMSFGIGRGVAEVQILKNNETGPISWNFLTTELDRGIAKCHLSSVEAMPMSKS